MPHEDEIGAEPPGSDRRHRAAHAEFARLIAGRRDHAPAARSADRDRLSAQFGVVALFDAGEEGVHVDMDDLAQALRLVAFVLRVLAGFHAPRIGPGGAFRNHPMTNLRTLGAGGFPFAFQATKDLPCPGSHITATIDWASVS